MSGQDKKHQNFENSNSNSHAQIVNGDLEKCYCEGVCNIININNVLSIASRISVALYSILYIISIQIFYIIVELEAKTELFPNIYYL